MTGYVSILGIVILDIASIFDIASILGIVSILVYRLTVLNHKKIDARAVLEQKADENKRADGHSRGWTKGSF
jgi:hypothetical protein